MACELPLTNSEDTVIVDKDISEELKGRKIYLTTYGYACFWHKGDQKQYCLHKYIMGNPGCQVDHINRNKLDCRRENLRLATSSQNRANRVKKDGCSSKYIGVDWNKQLQKWRAYYRINGKYTHIGYFDDEDEAGKARDRAIAQTAIGLHAQMNFPEEQYLFKIQYIPQYESPPPIIHNYFGPSYHSH